MVYKILPFTIASGATAGDELEIDKFTMFALEWPTAFTGSVVTVQALSGDGSTWVDVAVEGGSAVSIAVDLGDINGLDASALELAALSKIRFVSDGAEGADRQFYLHCKG